MCCGSPKCQKAAVYACCSHERDLSVRIVVSQMSQRESLRPRTHESTRRADIVGSCRTKPENIHLTVAYLFSSSHFTHYSTPAVRVSGHFDVPSDARPSKSSKTYLEGCGQMSAVRIRQNRCLPSVLARVSRP